MKRDLFRRYVWLVDVVRHARKITFEEIARQWLESPLNEDHSPLALRTFHNHRDAIEHLFGIKIVCDRSDHNRYYIADVKSSDATKLKVWMLQTLSMSHIVKRAGSLESRIVLDITPEEKFGLMTIISAMKDNHVLHICYKIPAENDQTEFEIGPYCIRFYNNSWWILGRNMENNHMMSFELSRLRSVTTLDKKFVFPKTFDAEEYFRKYYGMGVGSEIEPYIIRLRARGRAREIIRSVPLQPTQEEVFTSADSSVFEYRLIPSREFVAALLEMGPEVELISPNSLRDEVRRTIMEMAQLYSPQLQTAN